MNDIKLSAWNERRRRRRRRRMEKEMMEAEAPDEKVVRDLLLLARQLINEGKPLHALQAVVMATKTRGGEEAVFHAMSHARELYRSRLEQDASVDRLASLFAECAIAEAQIESSAANDIATPSIALDAHGTSILAETGRMQLVVDAVSDGSSFICFKCGGVLLVTIAKTSIMHTGVFNPHPGWHYLFSHHTILQIDLCSLF